MQRSLRTTLFAVLLCMTLIGQAQPARQDSLWRVWADTSADLNQRIPALLTIYMADSTLTALDAVRRIVPNTADTLLSEIAFQHALATGILGTAHLNLGHRSKALALIERSLAQLDRLGKKELAADTYLWLCRLYARSAQWNTASIYLARALEGFEAMGDTTRICNALLMVAYTLQMIGDPARAERSFRRCLDLASGRDPAIEYEVLIRLSETATERGDLTTAMDHLERAKAMVARGSVSDGSALDGAEAEILLRQGDCAGALEGFGRRLAAWQHKDAPDQLSYAYACKARAHLCAHRYTDAVSTAAEGLAIATSAGLPKESIDNLEPLAMAYEGLGDTRNALRTWKRFYTMRDSANAALADSRLAGAMLSADFEQQQLADSLANAEQRRRLVLENEAVVAREKNRRNLFLFSGIGALVLAGGLWSRLRYTRRSRAAIQKEKDISEGLLLNILPEEVAEELKAKGHADAKHFDQATILFSDFKGFTEASERMSPQELVAELNTCFEAFDHIITARGIEKIKTIGDAYMCVGGLPDPNSSSPADVVHAALEMQAFITQRKALMDAQGRPAFQMRVGIHTGPVVAGIVGVKKFSYDIWGDTVNTASRMESSGAVGQVNISEATYALVKDASTPLGTGSAFTFTPRGKVQAKGKGEMEMYFVKSS